MIQKFSDRVVELGKITKSKGLFEIYSIASQRERDGKKVVHMEIGRPDFDTPKDIKNAAIAALNDGEVYYTDLFGIPELREAISNDLSRQIGVKYDPMNEIVVTTGASEALFAIWSAFLDADDEILIPSPCYSSYVHSVTYAGGKVREVPILENGKIIFDINKIEEAINPNTKLIMVNSPNNPTGYVMSKSELESIAQLAIKHDLIVISDECYDRFVFEGEFLSIASLPGMKERTIIVNSTSKTFSMTGWRIGYAAGPSEYIDRIAKIHSHMTVCTTSFAQYGAIEGYKHDLPEVNVMIDEFARRQKYVDQAFSSFKGIDYIKPLGAFYIFFDVSSTGYDSVSFCEDILSERGIALAPGSSFGTGWDSWVRLSYACSMEDIKFAMEQLQEFINEKK